MHISIFKFVSVAKPQQFENKQVMGKLSTSPFEHTSSDTILETSQVLLTGAQLFFIGMSNFLPTLHLTWLKMREIILIGCKPQLIIKTMAAQLKVHINTTTVTKHDNNKYDKLEKL